MADVLVVGVFEDRTQQEFLAGLFESQTRNHGHDLHMAGYLTHGCRFDNLTDHFRRGIETEGIDGIVVGVDGMGKPRNDKLSNLHAGLEAESGGSVNIDSKPVLWSIADPSVEEWMMADPMALREVIADRFDLDEPPEGNRPGSASAEATAKDRLQSWVGSLLPDGRPIGMGREYAEDVGRLVSLDRIGESRNPDLDELLQDRLPTFLERCATGR